MNQAFAKMNEEESRRQVGEKKGELEQILQDVKDSKTNADWAKKQKTKFTADMDKLKKLNQDEDTKR